LLKILDDDIATFQKWLGADASAIWGQKFNLLPLAG
jgi:hypothetical protein